MSSLTDEIVESLKTQPLWIINDTKTFQWLRWNHSELIEENQLGGGNILAILGLFAVLNYISKVYKILKTGKLPKTNKNDDDKTTFTEDRAFKSLLMDSPITIVFPQDDENLGNIWLTFRNVLSHKAQIPDGNSAFVVVQDSKNIPVELIQKFIKESPEKSFTKISEKGYICLVDKLISDVESLVDWVATDINEKYSTENIEKAHTWIKDNSLR